MISVDEAAIILQKHTISFGKSFVQIENALNEILEENLIADTDLPPFDRVMMDGIAIRCEDLQNFDTFKIIATVRAGEENIQVLNAGEAFEIMTGAALPSSANLVIPYEKLNIENDRAYIEHRDYKPFQNVHSRGTDFKKNDVLVARLTKLSSAQLGVAASIGKIEISVKRKPSVLFISTGDELVEISETPLSYQIRKSNDAAVKAILFPYISFFSTLHIQDDKSLLFSTLKEKENEYDIIIFSGGVSKGKYDFVPEIIKNNGYELLFHRVAQKPGKPFLCAKKDNKIIFGLPGNPVSSMIGCARYILPWLKQSLELDGDFPKVILSEDISNTSALTHFTPVKLFLNNGKMEIKKIVVNGSGDFASMDKASGWLEINPHSEMKKGSIGTYIPLKPFTF